MNHSSSVIRWFEQYLTERKRAVLCKDAKPSSFIIRNSDVPQGSAFGPLPSSMYINKISLGFDSALNYLIYAFDLYLYVQFLLEDLQHHLELMGDTQSTS